MTPERDDEAGDDTRRNTTMTMLARTAERVYWTGRYLERAETTARLLAVNTSLFLDAPRAAGITWAPLLAVTGGVELFDELYPDAAEDNVVRFLATDPVNAGSVLAALAQASENVRTTRAVFPGEVWEGVNDLYYEMAERRDDVVPRWTRHGWLARVIDRCHAIVGVMASSMSRDEAYAFLRIGRYFERADMTSRVLDVRARTIGGEHGVDEDLAWMSVLQSLDADQAYRRRVPLRINGASVLDFVLKDPSFPRSISTSLDTMASCLGEIGPQAEPLAACEGTRRVVADARVRALAWEGLSEWVDDLQVTLHGMHDALASTFFAIERSPRSLLRASA